MIQEDLEKLYEGTDITKFEKPKKINWSLTIWVIAGILSWFLIAYVIYLLNK